MRCNNKKKKTATTAEKGRERKKERGKEDIIKMNQVWSPGLNISINDWVQLIFLLAD